MKNSVIKNPKAFVAALLTVAIAVVGVELTIRSQLAETAVREWEPKQFLAHERDDHGKVLATANGSLNSPDAGRHQFFLIGGSTLREGLLPDAILQQRAWDVLGDDAPTISTLYSFDQTMAETARIALSLPIVDGDTVVLGINPRRFSFGQDAIDRERDGSRFSLLPGDKVAALGNRVVDEVNDLETTGPLARIGRSRVLTPWNSMDLFEHRLFLRNWLTGRLDTSTTESWSALTSLQLDQVSPTSLVDFETRDLRLPLRYAYGNEPLSQFEKTGIARQVESARVPDYLRNRIHDFALLDSLIAELRSSGAEVVLLELPRSAESVEAYRQVWVDYDERVAALSDQSGLSHVDLRQAGFSDDAFFDLEHLLAPHRGELSRLLFESLLGVELDL